MTSSEMVFTESRTLREQHMERTEVLVKVKALMMLPGDTHVTVDMAASFYEVPADAIESQIRRDRDELAGDGLDVLSGARLSAFKTESGYRSRAASLTLIPKRALLRLGMLLRDSEIAKQVRTELLNTNDQHPARSTVAQLSNRELALMVLAEADRADAAEALASERGEQLAVTGPKAATLDAIEAGEGMTLKTYRKSYFPDVPERDFFTHLYRRGFLINQREGGPWNPRTQKFRDGAQHGHPGAIANTYLYLHSALDRFDVRRYHARVRPGQPEIKLRDLLIRQGLTPKLITDADIERANS